MRTITTAEMQGILAALMDPAPEVQALALEFCAKGAGSEFEWPSANTLERGRILQRAAELLVSGSPVCRAEAVTAVAELDEGGTYITRIIALLEDPENYVKISAASALGNLGELAAPHVGEIAALLEDPDNDVKRSAAEALGNLGALAAPHVGEISALLKDSDNDVKRSAAEALGKLGPLTAPHVGEIAALLDDPDKFVKSFAAEVLGNLGALAAPHAGEIAVLLKDQFPVVRRSAVYALGELGERAAPYVGDIAALLEDRFSVVRRSAAAALGNHGALAAPHVGKIIALLDDPDLVVRHHAVPALGKLGEWVSPHLSEISMLLVDPEPVVKLSALRALGELAEWAAPHMGEIAALLQDSDSYVRNSAVEVLGKLGEAVAPRVGEVSALLKDADDEMKSSAAEALGNLGEWAAPHVGEIAALLKDADKSVKIFAASALGNLGEAAAPHVGDIAALLKDSDNDVKRSAADALIDLGEFAAPHVGEIAALLKAPDNVVKNRGAVALANLGDAAAPHAGEIAALLKDPDSSVRDSAAESLVNLGAAVSSVRNSHPYLLVSLTPRDFIEAGHLNPEDASESNWLAYYLTGSQEEARWLTLHLASRVRLAGLPEPNWSESEEADEAVKRLTRVIREWRSDAPRTVAAASRLSADVVREGRLNSEALPLLRDLSDALQAARHHNEATVVNSRISQIETLNTLKVAVRRFAGIFGLHLSVWAFLIIVYPWDTPFSRWIQAQIFWNRWVRQLGGAFYVPMLLSGVPFLRRLMFAPFRTSLVRRAESDAFDAYSFYDGLRVRQVSGVKRSRAAETFAASSVLPSLRGPVVLQGASGLGKSTLLRSLAMTSRRTVALLRATECEQGIVAALRSRLLHAVGDDNFLKTLLHAGAVDILVDGLNEASPDTRVRVIRDMEEQFRGNILLSTQLLPGKLPETAQVWEVLELLPEQLVEFLAKQGEALVPEGFDREIWLKDYRIRVETFIEDLNQRSETDLLAKEERRQLCNPLEASIAAEILARGDTPNLRKILDQQAEDMEREFHGEHGRDFNRSEVAEATLAWRQGGRPWVDVSEFRDEALAMEERRLLIRRQEKGSDGQPEERWRYRHDKVMFYFLLPAFEDGGRARRFQYADDLRFNGIYDLLAQRLPLADAEELERHLINEAVDSGDNSLANRFTRLLRDRRLLVGIERSIPVPATSMPSSPINSPTMNETLLHISNDRPSPAKLDVVFVHGLMGDLRTTWTNEAGEFWPEWLAADFPDLDVWSLGYNAALSAWEEHSMPLADRGSALVDQLCNEGLGKNRPLVFITHSMGGLAVKQLLRHAESYGVKRWEGIAKNTVGIAFLSTPHSGANLASFATFVGKLLRTNPQVADMEKHSSRLRDLHNWFRAWVARQEPACRTWVERLPVKPKVFGVEMPAGLIVVDATSGEPQIPGEVAVPLDEDHISISKPALQSTNLYKGIRAFTQDCLDRIDSR